VSEAVDASEEILEGAEEVMEGVTQMARGFSGLALSGAFLLGVGAGGAAAYFLTKRMLEEKYRQIADDEIDEMREHYHAKVVASESKGSLEEIVRERGYAAEPEPTQPPMAVTPPAAVVEAAEEDEEDDEEHEIFVAPETAVSPEVVNAFDKYGDDVVRSEDGDVWDWHKERRNRSPNRPYVIHIDEREEYDTYDGVTYTYYEEDDVLCNERDEVVGKDERDTLVGEANLNKFGHGSDDPTVVYVRNDRLEMIMEICQSPNSYAEEVHGFEPDPELRHSDRRRRPFDDD
jgi:hypothetical protein